MFNFEDHIDCVICIGFSPNGKILASGSSDKFFIIKLRFL